MNRLLSSRKLSFRRNRGTRNTRREPCVETIPRRGLNVSEIRNEKEKQKRKKTISVSISYSDIVVFTVAVHDNIVIFASNAQRTYVEAFKVSDIGSSRNRSSRWFHLFQTIPSSFYLAICRFFTEKLVTFVLRF